MTAPAALQISYEDLYARWERGNWSAMAIDFSRDREDWAALSDFERRAAMWNYSLFFVGEDAVATDLAPFIEAAPREEQKYFLATQQVDEARHSVFFKRFMHEVAGVDGQSTRATLDAVRPQLTWGFRETFAMLDRITGVLRKDRSAPALARAVTMYHFIVEATLAQPGQHFITDYLERRDILPGFREGMKQVANDEQRHIAFGVKLLHDLAQADPRVPDAVADLLRESLPKTISLFWPPGGDRRYTEVFGATLEDIYEEGARSLESKLKAAGLPLDSLPGPQLLPLDLSPRERAERGIALVSHGFMGGGEIPPSKDPEAMEILFDMVRRAVDERHTPERPLTLQWDFQDAQPWHLRIDNGSTAAAPGRAEAADVTFRCRYRDWVDVMGGRADPRALLLRGRLRPKGSLRTLAQVPRLFPR
ncbi:MAG TPA: ribonucleotide-diphosphate reductase subunit beta [Solirubrobacteraceae bacterium]|nr:ribonucleotide-diphosphate reductase subunit beta [Solirubrobacteraceae bacterium]